MLHEVVERQSARDTRSRRHLAGERPRNDNAPRPWRVLPLAIGALVAAVATAAGATELLWNLSGERYAEEIIRGAL